MTVPLEHVLADLSLKRRENVVARSKELIQDHQQRLAKMQLAPLVKSAENS